MALMQLAAVPEWVGEPRLLGEVSVCGDLWIVRLRIPAQFAEPLGGVKASFGFYHPASNIQWTFQLAL